MSTTFLPCGVYHQTYAQDHAWWQTPFIKAKMLLLALLFGVLSFFIYKFLVKKIGEDTITPIITDTNKKATENGGILNSIFGSGETPQE